jgi:hypothetical protein
LSNEVQVSFRKRLLEDLISDHFRKIADELCQLLENTLPVALSRPCKFPQESSTSRKISFVYIHGIWSSVSEGAGTPCHQDPDSSCQEKKTLPPK